MVSDGNALKDRLAAGGVAVGASSVTYAKAVVETYGAIGLDYIFLDYEHNGPPVWDSPRFEDVVRAAEAAGVEPVVRLPSGGPQTHPPIVRKVLDTGVRNVVVPRVETAREVRRAVEASRFAYDGGPGQRGVGSARGSDWGAAIDADWLDREDATTMVGIMFENKSALANLDDILSVPELGFVFVGSNDLSVSLGCPLDFDHPDFQRALDEIRRGCDDAGVPYGQLGVSLERAEETVAEGGQLVNVGSDLGAIRSHLSAQRENLDV